MATKATAITFKDPPVISTLFSSTRWSWLWLITRLYLGYTWLSAGIEKLSEPGWFQTGENLKAFWERAVAIPDAPARPLIAFGWYRTFLVSLVDSGSYTWFAKLVIAGELLIGIALILGIFTGIAAFFKRFYELEFHDGWNCQLEPNYVPTCRSAHFGMESSGLLGTRSMGITSFGYTLATGKDI